VRVAGRGEGHLAGDATLAHVLQQVLVEGVHAVEVALGQRVGQRFQGRLAGDQVAQA
jgi:hypothetical protein